MFLSRVADFVGKWLPVGSRVILSSRVFSFAAAALVLVLGDFILGGEARSIGVLVSLAGVALLCGFGVGAVWSAITLVLRRRGSVVGVIVWTGIFMTLFALVAIDLQVFAKLGGRYSRLAVGALVVCVLASISLGALSQSLQPSGEREGWLLTRGMAVRGASAFLMLALALGLAAADRTQFDGGYPGAHLALGLTAFLLSAWAILLFMREMAALSWRFWFLVTSLAFGGLAFAFVSFSRPFLPSVEAILARPFSAIAFKGVRALTDFDTDGYSAFLGGADCNGFDRSMSPGSREIPGNGKDDNCLGGDAVHPLSISFPDPPRPTAPSPVNVVFVTVDTLRPDRMSAYGYEKNTTPKIARWAKATARFDSAYSSGGWTSQAMPSVLRGVSVRRLHWNRLVETNRGRALRYPVTAELGPGEQVRAQFLLPLNEPRKPIAHFLSRRGMHTMAVADGGFTEILSKKWGAAEGFEVFHDMTLVPKSRQTDAETARVAIEALKKVNRDQPYFLWVHFFGPHGPSTRRNGVPFWGDDVGDKYDHEIAYLDRQVGRLLDAIDSKQHDRETVVIFTADHGEYFYNKSSRGHGGNMSEENIRVPLFVKAPGVAAGTYRPLVSTVDIAATIYDVTGTPAPLWIDGVSLLKSLEVDPKASERVVFVDTFTRKPDEGGFRLDLVAAISGDHKLVLDRRTDSSRLSERSKFGKDPPNLALQVKSPQLRQQLDAYLEQTGGSAYVVD